MHRSIKNTVWSIAALLCGAVMYILLRPDSYIGEFFSGCDCFRYYQNEMRLIPASILRYYLPDMLWALALGCCLQAVLTPKGAGILLCGGTAFFCGMLWELLQYGKWLTGTGDWLDVLMYFCGALASVIINLKEIRK